MEKIRNIDGKVICYADANTRIVEIVSRGIKTKIKFCDDGSIKKKSKYLNK